MARSTEQCIAQVAARGSIGQGEARQILEDVATRAEQMRRSGADDPVVTAAWRMAQDLKDKAKADRIRALSNATKRNVVVDQIETAGGLRELTGSEKRLGPSLGLLGLRGGTKAGQILHSLLRYTPGANFYDSAEGLGHSLARQLTSKLVVDLRKAGVEEAAVSGLEDRGVAEALWRLNGGDPRADITVSRPAQAIAEAIHPVVDLMRSRLNNEGAAIGDAKDFVAHTTWDHRQLRLAAGKGAAREDAYAAWREREVPRMAEKTFDDVTPRDGETMEEARERMIRSIYDATESGIHMNFVGDDAPAYTPPAFEGSRNLARGVSQQRVVYWKDSEAWLAHQTEFGGGGSIDRQAFGSLDNGARRVGLMRVLGDNPAAALDLIARRVSEANRTSDNLGKFQEEVTIAKRELSYLDGSANIPQNEDRARRVDYFMTLEATAHLGAVQLTHLAAAPATVGSEMAAHGVGRLDTIGNIIASSLTGRGAIERQEILADAGAYAHGAALNLQRNRQIGSGLPGWVSSKAAQFMRLTGLPRFVERIQTDAMKSVLMTRLGAAAGQTFDHLPEAQQEILRHYRINEREWDHLRSDPAPASFEGRRYMTPDAAQRVDPATVESALRSDGVITDKSTPQMIDREIQRYRYELGDRLLMYLNDTAEHGIVTPGVRERAMMMQGARPGSAYWVGARLFAQFKMWPIAAVNQIINREIAMAGRNSLGTTAWSIGTLLVLSTAGGALRMSINDAAAGNPQRNYMRPDTLLAALAQGGGLGIYADFLFGEANRMGAGLVGTVAGPAGSLLDRILQMKNRFISDLHTDPGKAMQHMWPDLAHLVVGQIPFANLIFLKGALDYMLWYHLYEAASPGWWDRTNRRLEKERGRVMTGYRPGGQIPWTPWGAGATTQTMLANH